MPALNWKAFEDLPGSARYNFEMLCRALIRRHYGRFGQFVALASQPGVEFHLKLLAACPLGAPGAWFGWQCRWYDLPSGKALGTTRRNKIEEAIRKTEKVLPDLTDWILWTRHPLTKGDQQWFRKLKTQMRLGLWTGTEVEELLTGDAEIFRSTYFGELVLSSVSLASLHENHAARIRGRWFPEAHQPVHVERTLRRMLGEVESWGDLTKVADSLRVAAKLITIATVDLAGSNAERTKRLIATAIGVADILNDAHTLVGRGDLDLLRQRLDQRMRVVQDIRNSNGGCDKPFRSFS